MDFTQFKYYITKLEQELKWVEQCTSIGFDVVNHTWGIDFTIELIMKILNDKEHKLADWIYEENFGHDNNVDIEDIYNILTEKYKGDNNNGNVL